MAPSHATTYRSKKGKRAAVTYHIVILLGFGDRVGNACAFVDGNISGSIWADDLTALLVIGFSFNRLNCFGGKTEMCGGLSCAEGLRRDDDLKADADGRRTT